MKNRAGIFWRILRPGPVAALIGLPGLIAFSDPVPVAANGFYVECPTTEVREGDSFEVTLVYTGTVGTNNYIGAYWHTDAATADSTDFVAQDSVLHWGTVEDSRDGRVNHTFSTREDTLIEGNEIFTVFFTPTDNVVNMNNPDRDNKCEITIIDDDPNVTGVGIVSTPARDETYGVGETIRFRATFSRAVEVDGNPALGLRVGSNWRSAGYLWGSGTRNLVFGYKVRSVDSDDDGVSMDGGYQDNNGRWHNFINHTAVTAVGSDTVAYRAYAGIGHQSGHRVDGSLTPIGTGMEITSTPAGGDSTYRYGETITVALTFSAAVDVDGTVLLNARAGTGDTWRGVTYKEGSGTRTLVFGYTVQSRDLDTDGFRVEGSYVQDGVRHGFGGNGTVKVAGTDTEVPPNFSGLSDQAGHKLDGRPYPRTIAITSTPTATSDTYGKGDTIEVSIDFGQAVDAADTVFAVIRMGSIANQRHLPLVSGSGTDTLRFEYEVAEGDRDSNGIDAFLPHGLDIKAAGTDIAYVPNPGGETPAMGEDPAHKVDGRLTGNDTRAPTISSITFTGSPGPGADSTYAAGDYVGVWVTFSESVLATGAPQVELDVGGAARMAEYGKLSGGRTIDPKVRSIANATLIFGYTVQEGDVDSDGISIGENKVSLNGGTIADGADNAAVLTHSAVAADPGHRVYAPDNTAPTVSSVAITSNAGDDSTYAIGDSVRVTVTFSEDVTVNVGGTLQLLIELDVGGTARNADYHSSDSSAVVFSYTVASGDVDSDGISIGPDKISLDDATIRDTAGNDATLTQTADPEVTAAHPAVAADAAHKVDGVRPAFSSAATSTDGTTLTVTFSENVTIPALLRSISTTVNVALGRFFIAVVGVTVDDDDVIPTAASLSGTNLTMTLGAAVTTGQEVEVAYNNIFARDAVGIFIDTAGNALQNFSSQDVTNNSTVADSDEDDPPELALNKTETPVTEGSSATYTIALGSQPTADVTVTIASSSTKLTVNLTSLTFTTDNWNTAQTVTLTAGQDDDTLNYWVSVSNTASGGGYDGAAAKVYVVIQDND